MFVTAFGSDGVKEIGGGAGGGPAVGSSGGISKFECFGSFRSRDVTLPGTGRTRRLAASWVSRGLGLRGLRRRRRALSGL